VLLSLCNLRTSGAVVPWGHLLRRPRRRKVSTAISEECRETATVAAAEAANDEEVTLLGGYSFLVLGCRFLLLPDRTGPGALKAESSSNRRRPCLT
jgi:hypothetical protein